VTSQQQSELLCNWRSVGQFILELSPSETHDQISAVVKAAAVLLSWGMLTDERMGLSCDRSQSLSVLVTHIYILQGFFVFYLFFNSLFCHHLLRPAVQVSYRKLYCQQQYDWSYFCLWWTVKWSDPGPCCLKDPLQPQEHEVSANKYSDLLKINVKHVILLPPTTTDEFNNYSQWYYSGKVLHVLGNNCNIHKDIHEYIYSRLSWSSICLFLPFRSESFLFQNPVKHLN